MSYAEIFQGPSLRFPKLTFKCDHCDKSAFIKERGHFISDTDYMEWELMGDTIAPIFCSEECIIKFMRQEI